MAEEAPASERMTVEAFLEWDDGTDTRHELVDGRLVAMNPPVAQHARLLSQLVAVLVGRVPPHCGVYTGGGARQADDAWNFRIPDVSVSCTPSNQQWVEAPRLICEILSPSTASLDVTAKLDFYRGIPSVEEILILRANKRQATLWRRHGADWLVRDFIGSATIDSGVTTSPIPLDELYAPLSLEAAEPEVGEPGDPA